MTTHFNSHIGPPPDRHTHVCAHTHTHWQAKRNGKGQRMKRYVDLFFSNSIAEAKNMDSNNSRVHCYGQRSQDDKNLFTQIQLNRRPDVPMQWGKTDSGTSNLCMQNIRTSKKLHDTTYKDKGRVLAPHKQWTGSQILKYLFTICKIYRFQQTAIDLKKKELRV